MSTSHPKPGPIEAEIASFAGPFVLFVVTLCPDVYVGDSGELTTVAFGLGVAHPPGYPVYTLLGKAMSFLPLGSVAFRMNLLSALFGSATCWAIGRVLRCTGAGVWPSLAGSFLAAVTFSLWSQSVAAEVYTLHTFLLVCQLALLTRWLSEPRFKELVALGLVVGLSLAHHTSGLIYAAVFGVAVIWKSRSPRALIALLSVLAVAVLCYLQLSIRHAAHPFNDWGHIDSGAALWAHASGRMYHERLLGAAVDGLYLRRTGEAIWFVLRQHGPLILFAVWGVIAMTKRNRPLALCLFAVALSNLVFAISYRVKDLEVYSLPAHLVVTLFEAWGIGQAIQWVRAKKEIVTRYLTAALLLCPGLVAVFRISEANLRTFHLAGAYISCATDSLPPSNPVYFKVAADNLAFLAFYHHRVGGSRPDVRILNCNLSSRHLNRNWPVPSDARVFSSDPHTGLFCRDGSVRGDIPAHRVRPHGLLYALETGTSGTQVHQWTCPELEPLVVKRWPDPMVQHLSGNYFYQRAVEAKRKGSPDRAEALLSKARKADDSNPNMHFNVGLVLDRMGRYALSVKAYRKSLELAETRMLARKARDKLALAEKLVALAPFDTVEKHYTAARTLASAEAIKRAVHHLEAALRLKPDHQASLVTLGGIYANQRKYRAALRLWQRAAVRQPENLYLRRNIARLRKLLSATR